MSTFYARYPVFTGGGVTSLNGLTGALTLVDAGTDGITITSVGTTITLSQHVADSTNNGYLSSTDFNTFSAKQPAGNYITALTGDGTATGPGSVAFTLATVNSNVGSFGIAASVGTFTVNAKGLITAASNTAIQIAESQVTNLVSDLAGKQPIGNYITALTGDVTAAGPGSVAATLATVNANVGSFTGANITVNAKGLITAAANGNAITALTGDGTATGPGSVAFTLATVNANVGSFGTASSTGTFTVNGKGLITAASSTSIQITESQVTNLTTDLAGKANTALSNLASTAVNADIVPVSNSINLGSTSLPFGFLYGQNMLNPIATSNLTIHTQNTTGSTNSGTISFTSGNIENGQSGDVHIFTGGESGAGTTGNTGSISILTGNATGVTSGNSGNILIETGNATGTNGSIIMRGSPINMTGSRVSAVGAATAATDALNANLASGNIYVGSAGGIATSVVMSGDATIVASGALTLATVNTTTGSFGTASSVGSFTVNGKGLVTASSAISIQIAESQVTNLVSDLAGKQATGNYITALTGDATASGPGSVALTLATVNANTGSFGSSTSIPNFTVNGKGLLTAAGSNVVIAPAGTLSGTTLNATVVSSSLTSVGTIATGVWNGTTIAIANGGTGQTSQAPAFDALQPMTTGGDIIYGGVSGTGTRLANGSFGQVLTSSGGTGAPTWAAVAAGTKNYITFNNFENNATTGWSLGTVGTLTNNIPTGSPTFGSGASGNLSIATVSSGQLAGAYSLSYVSSAATTSGNMLATQAYTIDAEDQAKVLTFKFYYSAFSGAANCNFSGTSSNSFGIAIYDVTNSSWLTSTANFGMTQGSAIGYVTGTCQTNATTASLRFVIYNANATAGAATMYFDDFFLGPQTAPLGAVATDFTSFTPTGAWSANTTYTGWWKRSGDSLSMIVKVALAGAPTSASLTITLPNGYTIDTTKLPATPTNQVLGQLIGQGAAHTFSGVVLYSSTTAVGAFYTLDGNTASIMSYAAVTQAAPYTFANADFIYLYINDIPISGWSSNVQMSSDTDTRVIAARMTGATATITGSYSDITWTTVVNDTSASMGAISYTVPVTGYYDIVGAIDVGATSLSAAGGFFVGLNTGSVILENKFIFDLNVPENESLDFNYGSVLLNAGSTFKLQVKTTGTVGTPVINSSATTNFLSISRKSGPAVIASTESVGMSAQNTSALSLTNTTLTTFTGWTKVYDSHNAFNTGGIYTVPVSGKYRCSLQLGVAPSTNNVGLVQASIVQAGSLSTTATANGSFGSAGGNTYCTSSCFIFNCLAGDTLTLKAMQNNGGTLTVSSTAAFNCVSIERVGN